MESTRLSGILRRLDLRPSEVADNSGVRRETVWRWTTGASVPMGDNLTALLAYLRRFDPSLEASDLLPEPQPPQDLPDVPQAAAGGGRR